MSGVLRTLLVLYVLLVLFSQVVGDMPVRDDNMYVAAGMLMREHRLYADFAYLQTPYMAWVYHWLFAATGYSMPMLAAKMLKFVLAMAEVGIFYLLARRLSGSRRLAAAAVLLLVSNALFRTTVTVVRNYDMASLAVLAALLLMERGKGASREGDGKEGPLRPLAAGALTGVAIGTKLTFGLMPLVFLLPMLLVRPRLGRQALAYTAGLAAALLPAAAQLLAVGPDVAVYNNLGYHLMNAEWFRTTSETAAAVAAGDKMGLMANVVLHRGRNVMVLLVPVFMLLAGAPGRGMDTGERRSLARLCTLTAVALLMFLAATPSWDWYLHLAMTSMLLLGAMLYGRLGRSDLMPARRLVWGLAAMAVLSNVIVDSKGFGRIPFPRLWQPVAFHREMASMRELVPDSLLDRPVATVHTAFALEAGLDIYPELSCGDFTARTADSLTEGELESFSVAAPGTMHDLLEEEPPCAVLVNRMPWYWEVPLLEHAEANGFVEFNCMQRYSFWVAPAAEEPTAGGD